MYRWLALRTCQSPTARIRNAVCKKLLSFSFTHFLIKKNSRTLLNDDLNRCSTLKAPEGNFYSVTHADVCNFDDVYFQRQLVCKLSDKELWIYAIFTVDAIEHFEVCDTLSSVCSRWLLVFGLVLCFLFLFFFGGEGALSDAVLLELCWDLLLYLCVHSCYITFFVFSYAILLLNPTSS